MGRRDGVRRVAIACQGGGSHTAFTAGVLKRLLTEQKGNYEVVALSGTSGGAICAFLAWYALLDKDGDKAEKLLGSFWNDNSAYTFHEKFVNDLFVWTNRLEGAIVLPTVSPYSTYLSSWAQDQLRKLLERQPINFKSLKERAVSSTLMLLVGAVDVISGEFKAFNSLKGEVGVDTILASAALPTLFRAVRIGEGVYWDGLFSQNPPVRELTDANPDEIWVIQIDPERRDREPKSMADILDRRNELAGNLSLHQEIHFIEKINELVDKLGEGDDPDTKRLPLPGEEKEYKIIEVRRIEMSEPLDFASKLDRSPSFIRRLMSYGDRRAGEFLEAIAFEAAWRARDPEVVMHFFAEEAEVKLVPPLAGHAIYRGKREIRSVVEEHLANGLRLDPTKHRVTGDRVTWAVRAPSSHSSGNTVEGKAEAVFREGKIKSFTFEMQRGYVSENRLSPSA